MVKIGQLSKFEFRVSCFVLRIYTKQRVVQKMTQTLALGEEL
jgi:hypothetical protein